MLLSDLGSSTYKCTRVQVQVLCYSLSTSTSTSTCLVTCTRVQVQVHWNVLEYKYKYFMLQSYEKITTSFKGLFSHRCKFCLSMSNPLSTISLRSMFMDYTLHYVVLDINVSLFNMVWAALPTKGFITNTLFRHRYRLVLIREWVSLSVLQVHS